MIKHFIPKQVKVITCIYKCTRIQATDKANVFPSMCTFYTFLSIFNACNTVILFFTTYKTDEWTSIPCTVDVCVVVQFSPCFKFSFLLFLGMVMYDNEFETKENKI